MEQEDDDQPGLQDIRHTLQLPPDVREGEVRQEPQAGAAAQGLHRGPARGPNHQQQQLHFLQDREGRRRGGAEGAAEREAVERGGGAAAAGVQPLHAELLPGLRDGVSHSGE